MKVVDAGWVTVEAAAQAVGVDLTILRGWCRAGDVQSFRDGPYRRFVRLDEVQQHVHLTRGRPQTSLHSLIATHAAEKRGRPREALIAALQDQIRERTLTS
jgi:hypothetical protein